MTETERELFDTLLEEVMLDFPPGAFDDMPLVVDDLPGEEVIEALELSHDDRQTICGAFQKFPRRGRSMLTPYRPDTPSKVYLFREGILRKAGGWMRDDAGERVKEQIRDTLREQVARRFEKEKDESKHWRAF